MSYEPTQWSAGDTVTSAKLNKIEQGISNNSSVEVIEMTATENGFVFSKTAKEIANLMKSGKLIFVRYYQEGDNTYYCINLYINAMQKSNSSPWYFVANAPDEDFSTFTFVAETDNDYPTFTPPSEDNSGAGDNSGPTDPPS